MAGSSGAEATHAGPLLVVTAPDGAERAPITMAPPRVTVGRAVPGYDPDVVLGPDPQRWVSRLHCSFEIEQGTWFVVDNGSVNGTMVERSGERSRVDGRRRLENGDDVLILGYLVDDTPFWWRMRYLDPFATLDGSAAGRRSGPYVEYSVEQARLVVVDGSERIEVHKLGPNAHKLVRHLVDRNRVNGGVAVVCSQDELIEAVWGPPETWRRHNAYTVENLRDLVFELRRKLRPHDHVLRTITGMGYSLVTAPSEDRWE